jgi:hypothetical protein
MTTALDTSRLRRVALAQFKKQVAGDRFGGDDTIARPDAVGLVVRRQDLQFTDVGPGRVQITITVTNLGTSRSQASRALIQAAALGAFVDWRPLAVLSVPALEVGESALLRTEAQRVILDPQGSIDRLPPGRLLTALGFDEEEGRTGRKRADGSGAPPTRQSRALPPSALELLTDPNTHWAGNINVFVAGKAFERHLAKALRIFPARTNVAMFVVGGGPDSYRFDLLGVGPDWDAAIVDPMNARSLSRGMSDGTAIEPGSWHALRSHSLLFLALRPPAGCREGDVEVHVTKQSTRQTAVVEFSFDPGAVGPGCYVVD